MGVVADNASALPRGPASKLARWAGASATALVLATLATSLGGCSSDSLALPKINDLNPFMKKEAPLPGKRVAIMDAKAGAAANLAPADRPVVLPPPIGNDSWSQPGGSSNNAPGHLSLNPTLKQAWSADAGTGSSKGAKVTASPIAFDGRIYTLDAAARVSAFAATGGSAVWRVSLVPEKESKAGSFWSLGSSNAIGGYGGGLAADNGRLFVATGFGTVSALDPRSGKVLWTKTMGAPLRASPTAHGDRVYVTTADGRILALAGSDGSELWNAKGLPEQASLIGSPSPAVEGDIVAAPFPSGEVLGLKAATGETVWTESLIRGRGRTAMSAMSDAGRPAIAGGIVYATAYGGRLAAVRAGSGDRLWAIDFSSTQAPWVAGDYLFAVDSGGQLQAISRSDGATIWTMNLPGAKTWSGPVLAGGQLWLVSNKGTLAGVDAATGRVTSQQSVGSPGYIAPIVAGGRLYVLTDSARLVAFN